MMKRAWISIAAALVLMAGIAAGQQAKTDVPPVDDEALARWEAMRFGMFIHWGPVSLKGTEIGWSRGEEVPQAEYDQLYKRFNPVQFNADEWVQVAKDAGMRYLIITSKHHDGFCLWDSKHTDYDIMNTPFGRDVLEELSEACKEAGIAFGTYYSILDWYQPDYNTMDAQGGPGYALPEGQEPSMDRYQRYLESQVQELAENYGPLLTMWFDGEWEQRWTAERGVRLYKFCRELDPHMLVNNRVGKARQGMEGVTAEDALSPADYDTPEQRVGQYNDERPWETCMTLCQQWAWKPNDEMKSLKECIRTLVKTAGGDGNLLLNVGPMPDGRIEPRQAERLREIGEWLEVNGESIYGTRGGPFRPGEWGCSTRKGDTIYLHVFTWDGGRVELPPLERTIQSAALLEGGPVQFTQSAEGIEVRVPPDQQDAVDTIVALEMD